MKDLNLEKSRRVAVAFELLRAFASNQRFDPNGHKAPDMMIRAAFNVADAWIAEVDRQTTSHDGK